MKLPYGQSNFKNIATQGFYYVDRSGYIERLEEENNRFLFYLRQIPDLRAYAMVFVGNEDKSVVRVG